MRTFLYPLLALGLFGADWPQFRGPNGSGLCPSCGQLPTEFGPQKNVLWKTELPAGKSSPILVGDRIFLTASEGDDLITMCLSRTTGKVQWRRSVRAARREAQNPLNHRAAPTAVTDGKSVFVFFADFGLIAYDFEGKQRWQLPLGPFNSLHGIVASPVYADGRVILVCDQDTDAYIIAVDADSGKIAWKTPRDVINGYSTPIIYRPARGPAQIIAPGSYQLTAYSIVDGEPLWFVRGLTCQPKSAPTIAGDIVYFNGWTVGKRRGRAGRTARLRRGDRLSRCQSRREALSDRTSTAVAAHGNLACDRLGSGWFSERAGMDILPHSPCLAQRFIGCEARRQRRRDRHARTLAI